MIDISKYIKAMPKAGYDNRRKPGISSSESVVGHGGVYGQTRAQPLAWVEREVERAVDYRQDSRQVPSV